ncbi:MAG TPA: hypothetical protein VN154_11295 [Rhizomicrobium sp.]|nr:hypothetical protein [Rhizomicrobium sp.]
MFPVDLRRDIVLLLAIKAALLTLIYFLFFFRPGDARPDAQGLQAQVFAAGAELSAPRATSAPRE